MIIILLGPPGAGKGTQADIIKKHFQIPKLSTGDMLRDIRNSGTDLGKEIQERMSAGKLVSDEIVIRMVHQRIKQPDCQKGFILDGFPRNLGQANALMEIFNEEDLELDSVIELKVDDAKLIERISGRFSCAKCKAGYHDTFKPLDDSKACKECGSTDFSRRKDDNATTVMKRLQGYHSETKPLLPFYRDMGKLHSVNAMEKIDDVTQAIEDHLKSIKSH